MKRSIKILSALATLFIAFSFYSSRTPHIDNLDVLLEGQKAIGQVSKAERAATVADAYFVDYNVPSLVVGIIEKGKEPVFISRGNTTRKGKKAVNENTVYQIGSLSKTFTAIIAQKLTANGVLDLDRSILDYISHEFSLETVAKLQSIRIKDVLRHQAGFVRKSPSVKRVPLGGPVRNDYTRDLVLQDLEQTELISTPGTTMSYSNFGYAVMGLILSDITQKSYSRLVEEYITQPYGMSETTADFNHKFTNEPATPYHPELKIIKTCPFKFGMQTPASGIFSTVTDLTKMMMQHITAYEDKSVDNPLILDKETIKVWDNPYSPLYGYGIFSWGEPGEGMIGHGGDTDGYAASYFFSPENDFGVVMLTSRSGEWFQKLERTMHREMLKSS